jgi:hypothetical protein
MNLNAVRCEALFVSALQQSEFPSAREVRDAVVRTVRDLGRIVAAVYVWDDAYDEERQLLSRGVFAAGSY